MRSLKLSTRQSPKISLILLDWSVRESFHFLSYLKSQNISRDQFEVIVVEYYSTISPALKKFQDEVDTWILLEMPNGHYYHKHLMYNVGALVARGEILVICDSDTMAKPTFLESILKEFERDPNIVLHLDQFRNVKPEYYPFNWPSFEEVMGDGCINNVNGITTGLAATQDLIHKRNYGACICVKRTDYIRVGGADEHIDYVGHICGPYDLTFRMFNAGLKVVWHYKEFLYHTWHPGSGGENNFLGPHDGMHMSTTSIEAMLTHRVQPHVTNPVIEQEQKGALPTFEEIQEKAISGQCFQITDLQFLQDAKRVQAHATATYQLSLKNGKVLMKGEEERGAMSLLDYRLAQEVGLSSLRNRIFGNSMDPLEVTAVKYIWFGICFAKKVARKGYRVARGPIRYCLNKAYKLGRLVMHPGRIPEVVVNRLKQVKGKISSFLEKGRRAAFDDVWDGFGENFAQSLMRVSQPTFCILGKDKYYFAKTLVRTLRRGRYVKVLSAEPFLSKILEEELAKSGGSKLLVMIDRAVYADYAYSFAPSLLSKLMIVPI